MKIIIFQEGFNLIIMMKNNKKNLTSHKPWWAFELFTDDIA